MNIGIVGTGNIGGMLAKAFASYRDLHVTVFNRTAAKARSLQAEVPTIEIARDLNQLAEISDVFFVCTKLSDGLEVLNQVAKSLRPGQIVATTISSLSLEDLAAMTPAQGAVVIPSITQSVNSGVMLVSYGPHFDDDAQERMDSLLRRISIPFVIQPTQVRVASDLVSCGPAFLAVLLTKWSDAAASTRELSTGEAEFLLSQMVIGLGELLKEGMTLSDVIRKVAVPGGVTESGITSLNRNTKDLFHRLHESTNNHKRTGNIVKFTTA